ncbi:MAG TPA: ABC transporter permease, partial [Gemmatimonadaceae bacterium]|nr:ABC transporter permease [Gemmatimonadaceae bacterium]
MPQQQVERYALVSSPRHQLILERFNDAAKRGVYSLQEYFALAGKAVGFIFVKPFYAGDLFQQMDVIGVGSLGIVLLTGFFTGMVLALQSSVQLQSLG